MQLEESWQDRTSFNVSPERYRKVLTEYYDLARRPDLDEAQALRVYEILKIAEDDEILSFLLNEIDELTYQELDIFDDDSETHFANEAAKVEEMLLDEFSEKTLKQFVTATRYHRSDSYSKSYYSVPRVEMAFDPDHISRISFEKAYFQDDAMFLCPYCGESYSRRNSNGEYRCLFCNGKLSLRSFLKEESISILAYLFLLFLVVFLFLA